MNILSLYDGMACGYISFTLAGIPIDRYDAYEIDKYAIQTAKHNFPMIQEHGDVFAADFMEYKGCDFLVGGSPCQFWSVAQSPDRRETTASGQGWELFQQYVRALKEAEPKYFIYENNKSMAKAIRESITETFGFEPIYINSALVSAQDRQRLYWVGKRNEDGTYSKVIVEQPEDRRILLRDIIEGGHDLTMNDKTYALTASYDGVIPNNTIERKQRNMVAESVSVRCRGREDGAKYEAHTDDRNGVVTANAVGVEVARPIRCFTLPREDGEQTQSKPYRVYDINGKGTTLCAEGGGMGAKTGLYAVPIKPQKVGEVADGSQGNRVHPVDGKAVTQQANSGGLGSNTGLYAIPIEFDEQGRPTKAVSATDGKEYTVYVVKDGQITVKGKTYPIKLIDGYYIIRELTVRECMRLQTVPKWYEFPVSNSRAYKMLGNGWTCEVIVHLINSALNNTTEKASKYVKQSFFDMFDI